MNTDRDRNARDRDDYDDTAARLDWYEPVPDDVLCEVVTRDGLCFWAFDRQAMPELTGQATADRELAAAMCAGCPVIDECLELELRATGPHTIGVWGALSDADRREVYRAWRARRALGTGGEQR
ncbi:MAG: WhiB family transcriptional regulator [Sciscionella sp.]